MQIREEDGRRKALRDVTTKKLAETKVTETSKDESQNGEKTQEKEQRETGEVEDIQGEKEQRRQEEEEEHAQVGAQRQVDAEGLNTVSILSTTVTMAISEFQNVTAFETSGMEPNCTSPSIGCNSRRPLAIRGDSINGSDDPGALVSQDKIDFYEGCDSVDEARLLWSSGDSSASRSAIKIETPEIHDLERKETPVMHSASLSEDFFPNVHALDIFGSPLRLDAEDSSGSYVSNGETSSDAYVEPTVEKHRLESRGWMSILNFQTLFGICAQPEKAMP